MIPCSMRFALAAAGMIGFAMVSAQEPPPADHAPPGSRLGHPPPMPRPGHPPPKGADAMLGGQEGRPPVARLIVEHLRRNNPRKFEEMMELRKEDPAAFRQELQGLVKAWRKRRQNPGRNATPEERKCLEISQQYHRAESDEERAALRKELDAAVEKAFEARMKAMEERMRRMERELAAFNQRLARLKENRKTICEDRVRELVRPADLEWRGDW